MGALRLNASPVTKTGGYDRDGSGASRLRSRYNERVEERQVRHIGDIIRESDYCVALDFAAAPGSKHHRFFRASKMLRLLLAATLDVLATIGWFVTLPFIAHDSRVLTAREQPRG